MASHGGLKNGRKTRQTKARQERVSIQPGPAEDGIVAEVFRRELGVPRRRTGSQQPRPADPHLGRVVRANTSSKPPKTVVKVRKITMSCSLSVSLSPQLEEGGDLYYCVPVPIGWELTVPKNLEAQGFQEDPSRQVPTEIISPYLPIGCDAWRGKIRAGLDYINDAPNIYGILGCPGDPHSPSSYYEVGVRFKFTLDPILSECISMAQASIHFASPLWQMLNAGSRQPEHLHRAFDKYRAYLINLLATDIQDLDQLKAFLDRYSDETTSPMRFALLKICGRVLWDFQFKSFTASGSEMVDQISVIAKLVEASISWQGTPCSLGRWAPTLLDLGRFLERRGQASEYRANNNDQETVVQTTFSGPGTSDSTETAINVGTMNECFVVDAAGCYHLDYASDDVSI